MSSRSSSPTGFTLIEVLLAIALSAALMALLGGAINLYMLRVDASRGTVEQAQLARGVLRMITDDLRNMAVIYQQDIASAEAAAESQALFDVDETDQEPLEESAADQTERPAVGVSGDAAVLQVDVSRIQPAYSIASDTPDQPITTSYLSPGITGVRYFLNEQGLVRQQASRDVAIEQELRGLSQAWDASTRVIATEVTDLQFRYHDGDQALSYWDLEEQEGVSPVAVEVRIGFKESGPQAQSTNGETARQSVRYYRVTVSLPAPLSAADDSLSEEEQASGMGGTL